MKLLEPETAVASTPDNNSFTPQQKEYLQGFLAGVAAQVPYAGLTAAGQLTATPQPGVANLAAPGEATWFGFPVSDITKQEKWKMEENPLDSWDQLLALAEKDQAPNDEEVFRLRYFGLFWVAPVQNSFMLRCRIPAGELTSAQLIGLAEIAENWGGGYSDVTTRSNLQIREIQPRDTVKVLTRLQELGLTAKGSGVDNVRNITASPTAGFDPVELIDTRPYAKGLHYYILNHRDLYGLPRKFNVAFDGGGSVSAVADTNDIGFLAVTVPEGKAVPPGVYFRCELAGITGHKQFATDSGILVRPSESVAVAAAMIRVFAEHGDRTDRKKARLKYLIDKWGIERFIEETQKQLAFPLPKVPLSDCVAMHPAVRHGHIGVYRQAQKGKNFVGVVIPVGRMNIKQMRRLAEIAANYGTGNLRLTPWQNLLIPDVPDAFVETVKRAIARIGFNHSASSIAGGLIACTGNQGCKYAATNTKGNAVDIGRYLEKWVKLDQPINIHFTGCPHSCAQHYMGDIGLLGAKAQVGGESVEAYNVALGGGYGHEQFVAREVFKAIPVTQLPALLEHILKTYLSRRTVGETFAEFTRRHDLKQLQELFSN